MFNCPNTFVRCVWYTSIFSVSIPLSLFPRVTAVDPPTEATEAPGDICINTLITQGIKGIKGIQGNTGVSNEGTCVCWRKGFRF